MKYVVIAHAIILPLYISSYPHIYSEDQPIALLLGPADPLLVEVLEDNGYYVVERSDLPGSLSAYGLIVATDFPGSAGLDSYVQDGGGLVYFAAAADSIDLSTNSFWIGAQSMGMTGPGENATVSVSSPFGSDLEIGDELLRADVSGAPYANVEDGAVVLATYTGGGVFAYGFEHGDGRVFFQAEINPDQGESDAQNNLEELVKSGLVWATADDISVEDFLPPGSGVTGGEAPAGTVDLVFSDQGFQSSDLTVPEDPVMSVYVNTEGELVNPTLYFEADGQEYFFHAPAGSDVLLTFDPALNFTAVRFEVDGSLGGTASVGFVTLRSVPACGIPQGAAAASVSLPSDASQVGTTGPVGSSIDITSSPLPMSSVIVGFDQDVNGYLMVFQSAGTEYQCPIQDEAIEITFDRPTVISEVTLQNDGPWGLDQGNTDDADAFSKFTLASETFLPDGYVAEPSPAPAQVETIDFTGEEEFLPVSQPSGRVSSIWVSAGAHLTDRYLYFRSGQDWYSLPINGQLNGTLITFNRSMEIEELYASVGQNTGQVIVGYVYAIPVQANAGSDLSIQEGRVVNLDGSKSSGPGGITFSWSQISGTYVVLRNPDSPTPSFNAPAVNERGEQLGFQLVVRDPEGNESVDTVVVSVKNERPQSNGPPEIGVINSVSVEEGDHAILTASAFDPDGDALKFSWNQIGGPDAQLTGTNTATLSMTAPEVSDNSVLTFEVKVSDGHGHQATRSVAVTVKDVAEQGVNPTVPLFSAGQDQVVREGTLVTIAGMRISGDLTGYEFRWDQVSGNPVTIMSGQGMDATFVAPDIDENTLQLTFRLSMFAAGGTLAGTDDVMVTVNDSPPPAREDESVTIEPEDQPPGPTLFEINEPGFTAIKRIDAEPPSEIHMLTLSGLGEAVSPAPSGPIVGVWLNVTGDASELTLHFTTAGRKYVMSAAYSEPVAFVFDKDITLEAVSFTSSSPVEQLQVGYYYGQVPISSVATPKPQAVESSSEDVPVIQTKPPTEGAIIKFARENQLAAAAIAIVIPLGIGVGLKMVSSKRRRLAANPARAIFPKEDPVAGEAEKVRPVIEELERMLGRNLDTAVSASDLLDRFGSGKAER